jgi:hypothetical protein
MLRLFRDEPAVAFLDDQPPVDELVAPSGADPFDDQHVREWRRGIRRRIPASQLVIRRKLRLHVEHIHRPPAIRLPGAQGEQARRFGQPENAHRGPLLEIRLQAQRRIEQTGAEADIGDPGAIGQIDLQQHVGAWPQRRLRRRHPAHPGAEPGDAEADRLQRRPEQRVLLEAIAAATALQEFLLNGCRIEPDRAAEQRIHAFEGDAGDMGGVQPGERRQIRNRSFGDADPGEVSGERKCVGHALSPPPPPAATGPLPRVRCSRPAPRAPT